MKKLLILLSLIFFIGLASAGTNGTAVDDLGNVYQCGTINQTGNYSMNQTITNNSISGSGCIVISAQNVSLEGVGFSIISSSDKPGVYTNQYNTSINNLSIDVGSGAGVNCVHLAGSTYSKISNIRADNSGTGIYLSSSNNNLIENITMTNNLGSGISLSLSSSNVIRNISANSSAIGILSSISSSNNLSEISILSSGTGISFTSSNTNQLTNISLIEDSVGMRIQSSSNNLFTNVSSYKNSYGLVIVSGTGNLYRNNSFTNNLKSNIITTELLDSTEKTFTKNNQVNLFFNITYPNRTVSTGYSHNVSIYPSTSFTSTVTDNNLTVSFTPQKVGIYTLIVNITDADGNKEVKKKLLLIGETYTRNSRLYMHSDVPTHGQPLAWAGYDSGSLLESPTTEEETRDCGSFVQISPDGSSNFYPIIKNISVGWYYKGTGTPRGKVQQYVSYSADGDYEGVLLSSVNYVFNYTNFTDLNFTSDYLRSFKFLGFKLSGSSPSIKSNATQQTYVDISYITAGPKIENISENPGSDIKDMEVLSSIFNDDTNKSATLEFEGDGTFTIVLNMTTDNYAIKYDEVSCEESEKCTINSNENGLINLTLELGSYHILEVRRDLTPFLVSQYKLNENNGTIAYDSSGNNHGTISGATWVNDGVLVSLVEGVDYTLDTTTGVLTLLGLERLYEWVSVSWSYNNEYGFHVSILKIIAGFCAIIILGGAIIILSKSYGEID